MPSLLPRESTNATSVIPASVQRPSPSDHRVGFSDSFTRLRVGSLALRPALLLFGNSRPRVATTPLPHATGAHGQLPGRDFNPLDLLLLLRTVTSCYPEFRTRDAYSACDWPGLPGGKSRSLACPRERNQREGHPTAPAVLRTALDLPLKPGGCGTRAARSDSPRRLPPALAANRGQSQGPV